MSQRGGGRAHLCTLAAIALLTVVGCASAPAPVVVPPAIPPASRDQKLGWIFRLEQQRALRDPGVPLASPPAAGPREGSFTPASTASLVALSIDPDPSIRRRATLAIGRVGSVEGTTALIAALSDPDAGTRATAAFGLGLIGPDAKAAIPSLEAALTDVSPDVRIRAIEGLGLIGEPSAAGSIARLSAGCGPVIAAIQPDQDAWPQPPDVEACRVALFALVRLGQFDRLAEVALGSDGQPVSRWWPVAYALQRINDRRAAPALLALATTPGNYTAGFALRGLAALKEPALVPIASTLARNADADVKVRIAAVRALGQVGGASAAEPLLELLAAPSLPTNLAIETVAALGLTGHVTAFDAIVERLTDASPAMRAAALAAGARLAPEPFLIVLAGLGTDSEWSVRAALAPVLATLPADRVTAAIEELVQDPDTRVHGPALEALAAVKAPTVGERLFAALEAADVVVRATAARVIGETRPDGGIPRLMAAYAKAQGDTAYGARAAALEALSKYGGEQAMATLRQALADREWPVRWRAAALLRTIGDPGARPERPAPLRLPVEFFESPALLRPAFSPHAFIETRQGTIELELNVVDAAVTTHNFIALARRDYFNGLIIHRLVPTFVVQDGDPRGDGEGGPGYTIPDELSSTPYLRGTVGMALDWRDTGGSQWFITLSPQPHLDAKYTAFGRVVNGWDVLDRLAPGDAIERIRIWDGVDFR